MANISKSLSDLNKSVNFYPVTFAATPLETAISRITSVKIVK
jgi:hypothetical protein